MNATATHESSQLAGAIPSNRYLFIIGAMKSGTTSLFRYLGRHPEICESKQKEPGYFCDRQFRTMAAPTYEELWNFDPLVHKYAMEASTGYTKYPEFGNAAKAIFDAGLRPKFIYIIRNPFERIESQYNHMYIRSELTSAMEITDQRIAAPSMYHAQIEQYLKYFPPENILLLEHEDIISAQEATLAKVHTFLGLEADWSSERYPKANVTTPSGKLTHQIKRSWGNHPLVKRSWPLISKTANLISPSPQRRFTGKEREQIRCFLMEDMEKLGRDFGIDVGKWGF